MEKLQEEILSMVVKKEMLSKQIGEVNASHSDKHQALMQQSSGMVFWKAISIIIVDLYVLPFGNSEVLFLNSL